MPKFEFGKNFRNQKNKNLQILIDGKDYNGIKDFREVKNIQFSSKNGLIILEGLFDLSNREIQISNLIQLDYLTISFSKELTKSFKLKFEDPIISLSFFLSKDSIDIIKANINRLKKKYKNFDTDYKTNIKFTLSEFKDVNILSFLQGMEKESSQDEENEIKIVKEEDEEGELDNPFLLHLLKKEEEEKEKEIKEKEEKEEKSNFLKRINYVKINDLENFIFPPKKENKNNINNKIIENYYMKKEKNSQISKKLNDIFTNNLMTMNINNIYLSSKKGEKKNQSLETKNISFNEELNDLRQNYINEILLNFITILFNNDKFNAQDESMSINDYTFVIISLVKNIENIIIDTKKSSKIDNENNKKYEYYIERLEKILSSLKLFHILFLNCFITNEDNTINYDELYDSHSSPKVQTMRKKMLIEWCMNQEKKYISKNNLVNININYNNNNEPGKKKDIIRQIISFGQIKTAIKVNNSSKNNIFINAKLSNLSKENNKSNEAFSFIINEQKKNKKGNKNNGFISYEALNNKDEINNSWVSFFLQSLLYIENKNQYIIKSIQLINDKVNDMDDKSKPVIKNDNNDTEILELNYLLLKIYENLMKSNKASNLINKIEDKEKKEKEKENDKDIIAYIEMFSNNNLFNTNNSDHFIQFILLFLLTKIIDINFQNSIDISKNILNKKLYILLTIIISEILSSNNSKNENGKTKIFNTILIIKLLQCLNISKKSKQKILIDIISKQSFEKIEKFWEIFEKDEENENITFISKELKELINGIFYMDKCDWYKAYQCFLKSKNYEYCMNAYINHIFCLLSEKRIEDIDFEEIINNLGEIQKFNSSLFIDFYEDFYQIISFIVNRDNDKFGYEEIIEMLNRYIEEYYHENKIFYLSEKNHRIIIKLLYHALLNKNEQNDKLILNGEESFIKLNNISFKDKKGLLTDILKDIIEHKNIQFSREYIC